MHDEEKGTTRETPLRPHGASLFRSQSSTPRSASPRAFQLYELLHVHRMHSFTRRMKSFNKDRNPDLALHPPSYMRQTCSSLIKRQGMRDQDSNRRTKTGKSRRTTSMGGTTSVRRKGTKEQQRRAYSSLEHERHDSINFAPNDTLGFLLEEMPEGLSWVQGYGTDVALNGQSSANRSAHGERRRRNSTQHSHRRHVSFDGALNDQSPKTTNTVNVRPSKIKPRGLDRKATCTSRPRSKQVKRTSMDLRSDKANNSSSGHFEDVVPATEKRLADLSRKPRPRSALPAIGRGRAATLVENKTTSKKASKKKTVARRMSQPQNSSGRESIEKRSSSAVQSFSQELSMNHKALTHDEEPSELCSEIEHRTEEQIHETSEKVCSIDTSNEVADMEGMAKSVIEGEEEEGNVVNDEMADYRMEEEAEESSEEDWRPMTYTTRPADEIFPVTPVAIDADQLAKEIRTQESNEGYCDALSKSLQSSEDSTSESNSESASESNEPCAETVSDNHSKSESETHSSDREMSEEFERTACVLPTKKRRRHFLRLRRGERLSREEGTSEQQDSRRAQLTRETRTRSPLVSRLQCCRISFKACFCGADVSPGPATDDDDDSPHQAVYFSD